MHSINLSHSIWPIQTVCPQTYTHLQVQHLSVRKARLCEGRAWH